MYYRWNNNKQLDPNGQYQMGIKALNMNIRCITCYPFIKINKNKSTNNYFLYQNDMYAVFKSETKRVNITTMYVYISFI